MAFNLDKILKGLGLPPLMPLNKKEEFKGKSSFDLGLGITGTARTTAPIAKKFPEYMEFPETYPGRVSEVVSQMGRPLGIPVKVPFIQKEFLRPETAPDKMFGHYIEMPEKVVTSLQELPYIIGERDVPEYKGKAYRIPSYAEDAKNMQIALRSLGYSESEAITAAILQTGGQAIIDVVIISRLISGGAKMLMPEPSNKIAAWKILGQPKTAAEATKNYYQLSHQFHPDKAGVQSAQAMVQINDAYAIIRKGLPTKVDFAKLGLEKALAPFTTPETPILRVKLPTTKTVTYRGITFPEKVPVKIEATPLKDILKFRIDKAPAPPILPFKQLPGYAPVPGQPPSMGLSIQNWERVGGIKSEIAKELVKKVGRARAETIIQNQGNQLVSQAATLGVKEVIARIVITPTIPKELEPLAQEARKYKSAEEFRRDVLSGQITERLGLKTQDLSLEKILSPSAREKIERFGAEFEGRAGTVKFLRKGGMAEGDILVVKKIGKMGDERFILYDGSNRASVAFEQGKKTIKGKVIDIGNYKDADAFLTDFYNQAVKGVEPGVPGIEGLRKVGLVPESKVSPSAKLPETPLTERGLVIKRETTLLKDRIKTLARGIREGGITTKAEIKKVQEGIIETIESYGVPAKDWAKFRDTIKNIQTPEQLAKALPKIETRVIQYAESASKKNIQDSLAQELKYTKPVKVGAKVIGKYDYETNKFFEEVRKNNVLNQEDAQQKLDSLPTEGLSEMEKINSRLLSLRVNGSKSSLELHERVLADIKRMKAAGKQAKEDADFEKIINRQEKINEVSAGIDSMKGDAKSLITKMENAYRLHGANLYSMINSIAGRDMAIKYDPQLWENHKETAIFYKTEDSIKEAMKIFEVKNRKGAVSKIHDMAGEKFEIIDKDGLKIEINKLQLIDIYNSTKNALIRDRYYNAFGEEQTKSLITNLTPKELELADYLQTQVGEYRSVLNERNIEITGRDMGYVENYWPSSAEKHVDIFDDLKIQGETPSAMKARIQNAKIYPTPKDAWMKYLKYMREAEHVKHLSRPYEDLKRIFTDRKIKNQITNKFGERVYNSLDQHIDNLSLHKTIERIDAFSGLYDKALNNWVKAKTFNPSMFVRQLGSTTNYIESMPTGKRLDWFRFFPEGITHPKATFDFMWKNAPFLKARFNRGYSEALQDAIQGSSKLSVSMGDYTKGITALVRTGDVTAIVYGGYPMVKSYLKAGHSMQEAINAFERATIHAQQSGLTSSRSHWQNSSNPFAKTLLRFKNTINQYARKQADAIISYKNKQIPLSKLAEVTAHYALWQPFLYVLLGWLTVQSFKAAGRIVRGEDPDIEIEELPSDIMEQLTVNYLQVIPLMDDLSRYVYRKSLGKRTYGVFQTPMLDEVQMGIQKMGKKEPTLMDFLEAISALQEPVTAIPTQNFLRHYKYISEEPEKTKPREGGESMDKILKDLGLPPLKPIGGLPALPGLPPLK